MDGLIQFFIDWGYIGLFFSAILAGSIIPFSSEVVLTVLVEMGADSTLCLISATLGNTFGGLLCYYMGYLGDMKKIEKWAGVSRERMDKVERFVRKYGSWMGFFGFLPLVGGAIIVVLGLMRANIHITTFMMVLGKFIRYLLLLLALQGVTSLF